MNLYYRDASILITSTGVEVDGRAYELAELDRVWHRRGERSWRALAGRGALGVTLGAPLACALLALLLAVRLHTSAAVTVALIGAALLLGLATVPFADLVLEFLDRSYARGSRQQEIWARWRGRPVLLLATTDALLFGKVYRALTRALEAQGHAAR